MSLKTDFSLADYLLKFRLKKEDLQGKNILDLGSGPLARVAQEVKSLNIKGAKVISLDSSFKAPPRDSANDALDFFRDTEQRTVDRVEGIFTKLPFNDESFDMIFSRGAMPLYLHDPEQIKEAFDEVIRVLKKGGTAYVSPIEHTKIIENNPAKTMTETHEKMGPFITKRLIEKALHDRNGIEYEFVNKKMKMSDFAVDLYATPESAFLILKKK